MIGKTGISLGFAAAGALLLAGTVAMAAAPSRLSVAVTDQMGQPIPGATVTVEVPRKAGKPRRITRKLPRRPRISRVDKSGKMVKLPPRRRDTTVSFPVPRMGDCSRPVKIVIRRGSRVIVRRYYPGWCDKTKIWVRYVDELNAFRDYDDSYSEE